MASNATKNYGLSQWVRTDKVLMDDFNADNVKIDAALAGKASASAVNGLQASVSSLNSGKASQAALDALQTTVSGKASQSELDALSQTVAQHTAELAKKGNCQVYQTSYAGTGRYGADNVNSLSFPKKPVLVFIAAPQSKTFLIQGAVTGWSEHGGVTQAYPLSLTWSGNTVRWYSAGNAVAQMNAIGSAYQVVAFLQAD